jgi:hypothetical protein
MDKEGKFSPFTPPTAYVLLPVVFFDPLTAKRIWMIVNILLIVLCARLSCRILPVSFLFALAMVLLCGRSLSNNLFLGQIYLLIVYLSLAGWHFISGNKKFAGGFCWGMAASVKLFPAVFMLPFLWKRDKSLLSGFVTGFLLLFLIAALYMGGHVMNEYFSVLLSHLNGKIEGQSPFAYQFQSWNALFRSLFVYDASVNPEPLYSSTLLFEILRFTVYALVTGMAIRSFYQIRSHSMALPFSVAIAGIAAFEILPASASYHFILLLLPMLLLYHALESKAYKFLLLGTFGMIGFLPQWIQDHLTPGTVGSFSRLFLVTLLFILSLAAVQQESKKENINP